MKEKSRKYYELHSIPKVQHLIDSTFKKFTQNISGSDTRTELLYPPNRCREIGDNPGAVIRTEPPLLSVNRGGSGQQSIRLSNNFHNSNEQLRPPLLEPVSAKQEFHFEWSATTVTGQ